MLTVISSKHFKTIPWKNGLGETTELAINEQGSLDCFDWRLSIASVKEDGFFSDFSGYDRSLILIEGNGLCLTHDETTQDNLINKLDIARFYGGYKTHGTLTSGGIQDFNIITNQKTISSNVQCFIQPYRAGVEIALNTLCFAYSLSSNIEVQSTKNEKQVVSVGNLLKISHLPEEENKYWISGKDMILVILKEKH